MLMGLRRWCSASGMFPVAHTDSFQAIMRKNIVWLLSHVRQSPNSILRAIAGRFDCPILKHWVEQVNDVAQFVI